MNWIEKKFEDEQYNKSGVTRLGKMYRFTHLGDGVLTEN